MVRIEIRCPSCSNRGYVEIAEEIINKSARGVTAINIAKDQMCAHSFVAYIDKNLAVRDCFITDFQLELPQMETTQKIEEKEIPSSEIVDVDLIKMNLSALTLANMIRASVFKKSVLIVSDQGFLKDHLFNFMKFIFQNSFEFDITAEKSEIYKKNKKIFKDYVVLDEKEVINDKDKILDPKKVKIERTIVQKFLAEYDTKSSLIIIKNEIQKSFELSKEIMALIENYKGQEKLGKKKLIDELSEKKGIKISFSYLEFLLDIIKNYFKFDLSTLSDYYFPAFGI